MNLLQSDPTWNPSDDNRSQKVRERGISSEVSKYLLQPALLHFPLVLILRAYPSIGIGYLLGLLVLGFSFLRKDKPDAFVQLCAYIASAEIIWRMTNVPVFWETGKYLLVILFGLGILRWKIRLAMRPILYLLVLVPSALLTIDKFGFSVASDYLSFNLSGPLLLGVAAIFFSGIRLSRQTINRLLLIAIVPITGVWVLAVSSTISFDRILFTNYSNFATSGGYAPNQVSAILGLGVLYCWLYHFNAGPKGTGSGLMIGIGLALLAQAILTFSRGGVFNLAFALPVASFFFTRGSRQSQQNIFAVLLVVGVGLLFLIPRLNEFTSGMLITRFENFNLTGRDQLMQADLQLWLRNPVWGVGVGISSLLRNEIMEVTRAASHTEYTRLLAEHGAMGLVAIILLVSMVWKSFRQAKGGVAKGTALGLAFWALAEMLHAAMRITSISFVFALPLAHLELDEE